MLSQHKRIDDAVSPVVGVILMVAVTVILAAVIGSFVLDLGNNVQANPQAGVTFDQSTDDFDGDGTDETYVTVQLISMENADKVTVTDNDAGTADRDLSSVGEEVTMKGVGTDTDGDGVIDDYEGYAEGDKISAIGHLEGKQAVLQTHKVKA